MLWAAPQRIFESVSIFEKERNQITKHFVWWWVILRCRWHSTGSLISMRTGANLWVFTSIFKCYFSVLTETKYQVDKQSPKVWNDMPKCLWSCKLSSVKLYFSLNLKMHALNQIRDSNLDTPFIAFDKLVLRFQSCQLTFLFKNISWKWLPCTVVCLN